MSKTVQDWQASTKTKPWWKPEWGEPDARLWEWLRAHPDFAYVDQEGEPHLGDIVAVHRTQDHSHRKDDDLGRPYDASDITECPVCMKGLYDMLLARVLPK